MTDKLCSQCGNPSNNLRLGLCVKCYNSQYYQSTKRTKDFKCPNCGKLDYRSRKGVCNKCYMKEYYKNNKDTFMKKAREWVQNNIERHRENMRLGARRRWASKTPEEKIFITRNQEVRRSESQKEKRRQYTKRYYQNTKDTLHRKEANRTAKEARRARENNVPNLLTRFEWRKIKEAYDNCCAYCGEKPKVLTQDHIIPISKGGWHVASNIVPACQPCNRKKGVGPPPAGFVKKRVVFD